MSVSSLAPGLLLAAPQLGDPNFVRSVVLLAHHDAQGALGWVLNGRGLTTVRELLDDADMIPPGVTLPESEAFASTVRVGGPVTPGSAWVLYEVGEGKTPSEDDHDLGGGYAVSSSRPVLEAIARGEGPKRFRLFLGYAGWGPSQVEGEIQRGAWLPASIVFPLLIDGDAETMWDAAYKATVGTSPMAFTGRRGSALVGASKATGHRQQATGNGQMV
jgi:putative transcriptional regulator